MYKLFNNDKHARSLIANDPFKGTAPKFLKIDKFSYHFTSYQE